MKLLLIDNFDSFTYILKHYLMLNEKQVEVIRNNDTILLNHDFVSDFDGIVLSPGPGVPNDSGYMPHVIAQYISVKPILGICLGHQALGQYLGADLVYANEPHHGVQTQIFHNSHIMFHGLPNAIDVGRYHSLMIAPNANIQKEYVETAHTSDGEVMAIAHKYKHVWAMQFHPESCMSSHGQQLINNWLNGIKL